MVLNCLIHVLVFIQIIFCILLQSVLNLYCYCDYYFIFYCIFCLPFFFSPPTPRLLILLFSVYAYVLCLVAESYPALSWPHALQSLRLVARILEWAAIWVVHDKGVLLISIKVDLGPETLLFLLYSNLFFYFSHSPKVSSANKGSFNSHLPHYITLHGNFSFLITLARTFNIVLSISIKNEHSNLYQNWMYNLFTNLVSIGDFLMVFLSFIDSDDLLTFSLNLLIIY